MNRVFYRAKYILSIVENVITDDIRSSYIGSIDLSSTTNAINVLGVAVSAINKCENQTADEEKAYISTEYTALGLESVLGSYDLYKNFLEGLVDINRSEYDYSTLITRYKQLYKLTETLPEEYRHCIYVSILNILVKRSMITTDIEFSNTIINIFTFK